MVWDDTDNDNPWWQDVLVMGAVWAVCIGVPALIALVLVWLN